MIILYHHCIRSKDGQYVHVEEMIGALKALGHEIVMVASMAMEKEEFGADALVLASSREGMANVLLESIAYGTPVIATPLWGTPEVVAVPEAGVLTKGRSVASIVEGVNRLFANYPSRELTRNYAEKFCWDDTTHGQLEIFRRALS